MNINLPSLFLCRLIVWGVIAGVAFATPLTPGEVVSEELRETLGEDYSLEAESSAEIPDIPGLTKNEDGSLSFNGEKVKSITGVDDGEEVYGSGESRGSGSANRGIGRSYGKGSYGDEKVSKISPIKSIDEVTKIDPIKSIQEIRSINEIKSIRPVPEDIARKFIKKNRLTSDIDGGQVGAVEGYTSGEEMSPSVQVWPMPDTDPTDYDKKLGECERLIASANKSPKKSSYGGSGESSYGGSGESKYGESTGGGLSELGSIEDVKEVKLKQ